MDPDSSVEKIKLSSAAAHSTGIDQEDGTASFPSPNYRNSENPVDTPPPPTSQQIAAEQEQEIDQDAKRLAYKKEFDEMRMECNRLAKLKELGRFEQDDLESYARKCSAVSMELSQIEPNKEEITKCLKKFRKWKKETGYQIVESYRTAKEKDQAKKTAEAKELATEEAYQQRLRDEAESLRAREVLSFSPECELIYADMVKQYKQYKKNGGNRGAWWGASRPGSLSGAKSIPTAVFTELINRVQGTNWRFEPSFSGGESFHKKCKGVDFIYHRHPPV